MRGSASPPGRHRQPLGRHLCTPPRLPAPAPLQARTLVPTIPFIQEAALQGARQGVFLGLLAPGVTTGMLQMSRVRRGLDAAERMYQQVRARAGDSGSGAGWWGRGVSHPPGLNLASCELPLLLLLPLLSLQVQAARDWTMRNRQAFQRQADTLHGQAAAKQAEAQAVRSVA